MLPSVFSIKRYYWSGWGDEPSLIEKLLNQVAQAVNRNSIKLEKRTIGNDKTNKGCPSSAWVVTGHSSTALGCV